MSTPNEVTNPASAAEQDYLKHIYLLQQDHGRATTQSLAGRLGVKAPSVTAMIKRLAEDQGGPLVRHTPYKGVELTDRGQSVALETLRHHRLIELFLNQQLDMPWDEVHDEADRLEHVFSERLEDRVAAKLGNPTIDPHGDPIPTREGVIAERPLVRLSDMRTGETGAVARIEQQDAPVLQYIGSLGLTIGAVVTVDQVAPFDGVMTLRVEGKRENDSHAIGRELTQAILVMPSHGRTSTQRSQRTK